RRAWVVLLGVALAIAPATARNRIAGGEWALLSANGGYNLALAHPPGLAANLPPVTAGNLDEIGARARTEASRALGRPVTTGEADRWWRAEAFRRVGEDPGGFVSRTLRRAALAAGALDVQDHRAWHAHRRDRLGWLPDPTLLIPGLALWGLWVGRGRREVRIAALLYAAGLASVALFLVVDRYRLVLYAITLPLAGVGLAGLRPVAIPLVLAVAGLASVEPFRGKVYLPPILAGPLGVASTLAAEGTVREVDELSNVGFAFARDGRPAEALPVYARALELDPGEPGLAKEAAAAAVAAGEPLRAATWLGEARRRNPRDPDLALVTCGVLLRIPTLAQGARSTCEAARTLAPGSAAAWWQAGMARWQLGLLDEAEAAIREALRLDPGLPDGERALATLAAERAR
ncbi:MAG: tetratricopeptide repeat protein, partial [Myxococcota bacterium]